MNFDEYARNWDTDMRISRAKVIANEINKSIDISNTYSAMEFGCGTGLVSFNLYDKFKNITLIDSSKGMIDILNSKIEKYKVDNMVARHLDISDIKLVNMNFDVIYNSMALHHIKDTQAIIKKFHEILNEDGYLCIIDLDEEDGTFHKEEPGFNGHNGFNQGELKNILISMGFKDVESNNFYYDEKIIEGKKVNYSFIADVTLAEYIRRRRLTQAAFDLQKEDCTVLDIALRYGYDSPVSFSRAFQNLHGLTPNEAKKKGSSLKSYPKISFKITIKGVEEMKYRIEKTKGIRLVGVMREITTINGENFKLIPQMWNEVWKDGTVEKIMNMGNKAEPEWYGVCCNFRTDEFDYMIAVESDSRELAEGGVELIIPELTWVKFECRGKLPEAQQNVWKRIFTEWFPNSGYEHADGPEIEWYSNESMESDNYLSEIWIPIKKSV